MISWPGLCGTRVPRRCPGTTRAQRAGALRHGHLLAATAGVFRLQRDLLRTDNAIRASRPSDDLAHSGRHDPRLYGLQVCHCLVTCIYSKFTRHTRRSITSVACPGVGHDTCFRLYVTVSHVMRLLHPMFTPANVPTNAKCVLRHHGLLRPGGDRSLSPLPRRRQFACRGMKDFDARFDTAKVEELQAPIREGFVAVEWGGMNLNGKVQHGRWGARS